MFGNFVSIWDAHENESLVKNGIKMCKCLLVVPIYGLGGFITRIFGFSNRGFRLRKPNWGGGEGVERPLAILDNSILTCQL
jgi:hypothetical protein